MNAGLQMWTIYHGAEDMPPGVYRVRRCVIGPNIVTHDRECTDHPTLESAREAIPPWLYCQPRHPFDEPHIVETWF